MTAPSPPLTLFGNLSSGNVYKVRLLWALLGIAHRRIDVSQPRGEPMSAAFRAINPIGKVPAVRLADGRLLTESGAILYYFAQGTPFWPEATWERTQVLRWMFFEQYSHEPVIAVNRYLLHFADDPEPHRERIAENARKATVVLDAMERQLADHDWFGAAEASIADLALYAYTHIAHEGDVELAPYPAIGLWLERVGGLGGHVGMYQETSCEPPVAFTDYLAAAGRRASA